MSAYVIVEVSIEDPILYEEYKKLTPATIAAFDGRFVVRGGKVISMEGNWEPERLVILEFPTMDKAKEWWHSKAYAPAKSIRQASATTKMIFMEGY